MKLNLECVRDLLIYCEDNLDLTPELQYTVKRLDDINRDMPQYSKQELAYTLTLLDEAMYIESKVIEYDGGIADILVWRLTYHGHEFIDTIRPKTVWDKISGKISEVATITLPILQQFATHALLNAYGLK